MSYSSKKYAFLNHLNLKTGIKDLEDGYEKKARTMFLKKILQRNL